MERSSQDRPASIVLDLSKRNSFLGSSHASAAMDLVKHQGWHSQLARSHSTAPSNIPQNKPQSLAPGHSLPDAALRLSSQGNWSRSLLPSSSRASLPGMDHSAGGPEAGVRPLATAVKNTVLDGGGVLSRGLEHGGGAVSVNRDRHPDSDRSLSQGLARDLFHTGLRTTRSGGLWKPGGLYDPDLSDSPSPSPESSGGEESQSDSDVIFLVSTAREDTLISQEDSTSLCSSLDRDCVSSEDRDPHYPVAAASLDQGRGCFRLPRPLSTPSPDSSDSDSSDSTGEILPPSSLLLMSELAAAYSNCASSPVDVSSDDSDDDDDNDDDEDSDVIEVPVTNERIRTPGFPLDVYSQRCQAEKGANVVLRKDAASPQPGSPPRPRGVRRSTRVPKPPDRHPVIFPSSTPKHSTPTTQKPTRNVYSRQAKGRTRSTSLSLHSESYDSGDMMNSTEKQSSSEEEEVEEAWPQIAVTLAADSEDSDADSQMVGEAPSDSRSHSESTPVRRGLSPGTMARSQPGLPAPTPTGAPRQTQATAPSSTSRKRLIKQTPCQRTALPTTNQPPRHPQPGSRAAAGSKTASESKAPPARRRKKKQASRVDPSLMFSPQELELQQKYARRREERRENKSDSFCPFIHVEWRECTVVNCQEEEKGVRGSSRSQQGAGGSGSLSAGVVPRTSCYQLGRLSSQSRTEVSQVCCLCGGPSNAMALGDLHGPYYPTGLGPQEQKFDNWPRDQSRHYQNHDQNGPPSSDPRVLRPVAENGFHGLSNGGVHHWNQAEDVKVKEEERRTEEDVVVLISDGEDSAVPWTAVSMDESLGLKPEPPHSPGPAAQPPYSPGECWIHEDCGIWSAGVFLVKGRLYGLEEAVWLARETVCTTCDRAGATMGCFLKGCPTKYHYRCAVQSGCALNEENFSMRCPKHKNKSFRDVTRLHNR